MRRLGSYQNFQPTVLTPDPTGPRKLGSVDPRVKTAAPEYDPPQAAQDPALAEQIDPATMAKAEALSEVPTRWARVRDLALPEIPLEAFFDRRPKVANDLPALTALPYDPGSCRLPMRSEAPAMIEVRNPVVSAILAEKAASMEGGESAPATSAPADDGSGIPSLRDVFELMKPVSREDWWKFLGGAAAGYALSHFFSERRR